MDRERKLEKIGNVTLDYTWYSGRDLYSDGDEEERLLALVKENPETDYDKVIAREANWTVLYHLSPVRENILGSVKVDPKDSVLEIGSGCGAVTGALLGRCASLTCVDLSKRRSRINALRHRDGEPYTILVGNFQDIEPDLPKYDLITLIGVFEYAQGYIGREEDEGGSCLRKTDPSVNDPKAKGISEKSPERKKADLDEEILSSVDRPYVMFLEQISAHLNPGGRIVIAIENRLGLKYFAGSAEDHTGVYFDGIEDYPEGRTPARTFSRPALEKIFERCGFKKPEFGYPYPDYKLPAVIHTDRYLPKAGELRRNRWNFDRKKLEILDEDAAVDAILQDGLYPQFANSFLVTLTKPEKRKRRSRRTKLSAEEMDSLTPEVTASNADPGKAVYTKFSDERDLRFALKTQIFEREDGTGFVRKSALAPEGNAHILLLAENGEKLAAMLEGTGITVNRVLGTGMEPADGLCARESSSADQADRKTDREAEAAEQTERGAAYADLERIDCSATLEGQLHALTAQGELEEAFGLLRDLCGRIASKASGPFAVTEAFAGLFGVPGYPFKDVTLPVTDIDMVAENLIPDGAGGYTLIDYEWTVDFPVPLRFVLFRIWHYFAARCLGEENAGICCAREGFTPEETRLFLEMEAAWQKNVKGNRTPLRELYSRISPGFTDGKAALGIGKRSGDTEFVSTLSMPGCDTVLTSVLSMENTGQFEVSFDLSEFFKGKEPADGKVHLRWDPLENIICRMKIRKVRAAALARISPMNGYGDADGWDSFWTMDPVYDIELDLGALRSMAVRAGADLKGGGEEGVRRAWKLVIEGEMETVNLYDDLERIDRIKAERDAYYAEMESLRRRIEAIRSTKAYKATEGLRRARNFTMARVRGTKLFADKNAGPKKYQDWLALHRADEKMLQDQRKMILPNSPKISILVPVYRTPENYLRAMIESVLAQSYRNWELCIADASGDGCADMAEGGPAGSAAGQAGDTGMSGMPHAERAEDGSGLSAAMGERPEGKQEGSRTAQIIREYAAKDPRIRLRILSENKGISANTNAAADMAAGDYITLLDHDDLLAADALFEVAQAISITGAKVLYTDEDKVNMLGTDHFEPNLKPDFSPDLLRSHNYITHLFIVEKNLFEAVDRLDSRYDGAQDYDLILRCTEAVDGKVVHIPRILYHWRSHESSTALNPESKLYAYEAGRAAVQAHLDRLGIKAKVKRSRYWGINRVLYPVRRDALVSVIIPNKDHVQDLDRCLTSLFERNTFPNLEVIVVENNSEDAKTFAWYEQAKRRWSALKVVTYKGSFNYAAINNFGAAAAKGDLLLLLNNDTRLLRADSIREMAGIASRRDVGCVGAKLLYGNGTVQHAGIVLGFGGFAGHVFVGIDGDSPGVMMRPLMVCNYSAVTAACLMVRRSVFEELGGLNEDYAVALNDVDFCLRAGRAGYLNVFTPWSLWYHFESQSRGYEDSPEKIARLQREVDRFRKDWADVLMTGDPYYNPNFPMDTAPFSLY